MSAAKEEVRLLLERLTDVESGRTLSEEEFDRRTAKWLEP